LDKFEKIDILLEEQGSFVSELNAEIDKLKKDDVYIQNDALREQLKTANIDLKQRAEISASLKTENIRLKNELYEQLFNEKTKLVNIFDKRLDAYFSAASQDEQNRLTRFESYIKHETDRMIIKLQQNRIQEESAAYESLRDLRDMVDLAIRTAKQDSERMQREILSRKADGIGRLREEPLTEDQMVRRAKQNNIESFLGLKIFNKLGLILIIVGVIAAVQFTYVYIPDALKGALAYALGIVMLGVGEIMNRRRPDVFSLGLTAGGIAVLYSATALSFFLLHILSMYPALALCVLITVAAFILSQRYDSQTVAAFAAIGGYLPILSVSGDKALVYYAIGYFILLNVFSLAVSVYKKWHIAQFVGFAMNFGSTYYILSLLSITYAESAKYLAVSYIFLGFIVYNALPIISSYRTGIKLKRPDNVLLILNTVLSSAMMFLAFGVFGIWNKTGFMAILFCVIYLLTAKIVRKKLKAEIACQALFYITGLAYAVLAIPLQLGVAYLSLGWLLEGAFLLSYGIWAEKREFLRAGIVISALCLFVFLTLDVLLKGPFFFYKYLFITLASVLVLSVLAVKSKTYAGAGMFFKYAAAVNMWIFLLYVIFAKIRPELAIATDDLWIGRYFARMTAVTVSLCYAYMIAKLKFISDGVIRWIAVGIYVLSVSSVIFINTENARVYTSGYSAALSAAGMVLIIVVNILAVLAVRDLVLRLTLEKKPGAEWYPIILSAFFVFAVMQNLVVAFDLSLNSIIITAVLAATALGWIIFGFAKRYQYIRLAGLGLSFLTVIKLFIIDLYFLSEGLRIVSYFLLGIALLAISFVYRYFSKKLDAPKGGEQA
jgi:uncharacterized membrane protein